MTTMPTTTHFHGVQLPPNALSELLQLIRNRNLSSSFEFIRSNAGSLDHIKKALLASGDEQQAEGFIPLTELTTADITLTACKFIDDILPKMFAVVEMNCRFKITPFEAAYVLDFFVRDWTTTKAKICNEFYEDNEMLEERDEDWADGMDECQDEEDEEMEEEEMMIEEDEDFSSLAKFFNVFPQMETIEHLTDEQFKIEFLQPIMWEHDRSKNIKVAKEAVGMLKRAMYAYVVMILCENWD
uniref:Uncharacterized protein n=1 Tax=Skeletonema marinoi TaxID=267567 RepID=A0A7S2LPJ6_9STRA|mmetsp:Transcript_27156/g.45994  ORF Transcript_27156/g.45994 Transcript_27156/m.45994 type:complete len:242 (+) Transcript_27156:166-891(+)